MALAHLVPRPGLSVFDPRTRKPLPADGAEVELGVYWTRRLADGDVQQRPAKAPAPKPAATKRATQTSQE